MQKSSNLSATLLSPAPKWNPKYLRRLRPELRDGLLELPTAIQLMLMQRHRGYLSENSIDVLNLQNPNRINQNSEYFEDGDFTTVKQLGIPLKYPTACNLGLWGGEGVLSGYITHVRNASRGQNLRIWNPHLIKRSLASEILNTKMNLICTHKTLDLIDEHYGFDFYILKTPDFKLRSKIGMTLKRQMFLNLLSPELKSSRPEIYQKYSKFKVDEFTALFTGLSIAECIDLHKKLEHSGKTVHEFVEEARL